MATQVPDITELAMLKTIYKKGSMMTEEEWKKYREKFYRKD